MWFSISRNASTRQLHSRIQPVRARRDGSKHLLLHFLLPLLLPLLLLYLFPLNIHEEAPVPQVLILTLEKKGSAQDNIRQNIQLLPTESHC